MDKEDKDTGVATDVVADDDTNPDKPTSVDVSFMLDGEVPENLVTAEDGMSDEDKQLLGIGDANKPDQLKNPELDPLHPDNIDLEQNMPIAERLKAMQDGTLAPEPEGEKVTKPDEDEGEPAKPVVKVSVTDDEPAKPAAQPAQPAAQPAKADEPAQTFAEKPSFSTEEQDFIKGLSEDDYEMLKFWDFAEGQEPEKYNGKFEEALGFLQKKRRQEENLISDNPDTVLSEDEDLKDWVQKHQPKISDRDYQKVQRRQTIEEAKAEVRAEQTQTIREQEERLNHIEKAPIVQKKFATFNEQANSIIPEDMQKIMIEAEEKNEDAGVALAKRFPAESRALAEHYTPLLNMGAELIKLSEGTVRPNPKNKMHVELNQNIKRYGQMMLTNPKMKDQLVNENGQTFTPREKWNKMDRDEQGRHWTFSDSQVLQIMVKDARNKAGVAMKEARSTTTKRDIQTLISYGMSKEEAEKKVLGAPQAKKQAVSAQKPSNDPSQDEESPKAGASRGGEIDGSGSAEPSGGATDFMLTPIDADTKPT
jgi:hypothetical protein